MKNARPYDRDVALDAAMTLFWEKGYYATSLKDLEFALKMKPGSIYAAFSSKENLFDLVLERYFERNRRELRASVEAASSPLTALAEHLRAIGRARSGDPKGRACMLVKTLLNMTADDAEIAKTASKYIGWMEDEMAAIFEQALQQGELAEGADIRQMAKRFQGNVTILRIEAQRGLEPAELQASAERLAQGILALGKTSANMH